MSLPFRCSHHTYNKYSLLLWLTGLYWICPVSFTMLLPLPFFPCSLHSFLPGVQLLPLRFPLSGALIPDLCRAVSPPIPVPRVSS